MKVRLPVWLGTFVLLLLLSAPPAHATVPGTLLVEGTLANIAGAPVADGPYSVVFTVYGDAVSPTPLWTEGPLSVVVKSGGFSQLLGVTTPLTGALLAAGTSPMLALKIVMLSFVGIYLLILVLVQSALAAIFQAALYLYAREGRAPAGFSETALAGAMSPREE